MAIHIGYDSELKQLDITNPDDPVEILIKNNGKAIWINIDGRCVLRVCGIKTLILEDRREGEVQKRGG